jgi:hypothetical protein
MQNFATTYSLTMAMMALLLAFCLAAVGWNRYTPRTRKPIDPQQLEKIRKLCRYGSPALLVLALLYLFSALPHTQS